jgi:hypothetical protein
MSTALETAGAALFFAGAFLLGNRVRLLRLVMPDLRGADSFSGGMAAAYVFIHLMPELSSARRAFTESVSWKLRFEGMTIYYLALVGFLLYYGLNLLHGSMKESASQPGKARLDFRIQIAGFAAYVGMVSYLLVRNLEETHASLALYAIALALHFRALDHALEHEEGEPYRMVGRRLLAGVCVLGWGLGMLVPLPLPAIAAMVAVISGAVIMNSSIMELGSRRHGRFMPFVVGGLAYGLLLLPLAH